MMHKVLNDLKIGVWEHAAPPNQDIPALLIKKLPPDQFGAGLANTLLRGLPVMLKVQWGGGASHAVVLDTITQIGGSSTFYGAICDPADGDVHITEFKVGSQIVYRGRRVTFSLNFWDSPAHGYGKTDNSQGVITEVVYCKTPP